MSFNAAYDDTKAANRVVLVSGTQSIGLVTVAGGGVSSNYAATATTYTAGTTQLWTDANGNLKTTLATQLAGEDLTNDVLKVEQRFSYATFTSATTVAVKSSAGFIHGYHVGAVSCPSIILYDSAVPSGTALARIACGMPLGFHPLDVSFNTGLSVDAIAGGGGVAPYITFSYR